MNTSTGSVQGELAHGDTHAVDAKVSETKDARAIRDDSNFDLVWPVLDNRVEVSLVLVGKVET